MHEMIEIEEGQRTLLYALFRAALDAASIEGKLDRFLPGVPSGRTIVVGAGKAAAAMASELDRVWPGSLSGAVVTPYGNAISSYRGRIEVLEASHPVPDQQSVIAGERMVGLLADLTADDQVIALISGGASALMVGLPEGITLADKRAVTNALLASGAPIAEINAVRRQLSTIKGGGLARLAGPARVVTLAISDIPGDALDAIGSGPTIISDRSVSAYRAILARYNIVPPSAIARYLARNSSADSGQDWRPRDLAHVVVRPRDCLAAAARVAQAAGFTPIVLGDDLQGEARELGAKHAQLARQIYCEGRRACLISGGETTVTVRAQGRGGRNGEYLLGALVELAGQPGIAALAADTDGIDGSEDNAGAVVFGSSIRRAEALGMDARASLAANDSYTFFAAIGDLIMTGPTRTNVNDFRAIVIDPAGR